MDEQNLIVNNVDDTLERRLPRSSSNLLSSQKLIIESLPLTRTLGHLFYQWTDSHVHFTTAELTQLHRRFFHPSTGKLFDILRLARPLECTPQTRDTLDKIAASCRTCQVYNNQTLRIKVAIPEDKIVFNQDIELDLVYLNGQAALHVVDTGANFSSAQFLAGHSVDDVWTPFLACWVPLYTGFPSSIHTGSGSVFTSPHWRQLTLELGIELKVSGVESHHSLGATERYHAALRRIFNKIR